MGINITNELKTKAGRSEDLIALLRQYLPSSLAHGGAEEISIRQDQDDPNYIVSVQRWESREAYLAYCAWRAEQGLAARIRELLEEPQKIRFFDEVLYGVPSAKAADRERRFA
jgi:quinol monooxygenase YgiN